MPSYTDPQQYNYPTSEQTPIPISYPEGWSEAFDPHYQRIYYYNYTTGERTWVKPTPAPAQPVLPPQSTLEDGVGSAQWESAVDPTHGRTYYFNRSTGERAWILPEGAKLKNNTTPASAAAPAAAAVVVPVGSGVEKEGELLQDQASLEGASKRDEDQGEISGSHAEEKYIEKYKSGSSVAPASAPTAEAESGELSPLQGQDHLETTAIPREGVTTEDKPAENYSTEVSKRRPPMPGEPAPGTVFEEILPPGWASAFDESRGVKYYYNREKNISQWTVPVAETTPSISNASTPNIGNGGGGGHGPGDKRGATSLGGGDNARRKHEYGNRGGNRSGGEVLDPMDPSSYSDAPRGGWGAGLGKDVD